MKRITIVIATKYGQTAKIADRLKQTLEKAGHEVAIFKVVSRRDQGSVSIAGFDAVIIGAPVYAGRFSTHLIDWTKQHLKSLSALPTAFFSVSLNAADTRPQARKEDVRLVNVFLEKTGLKTTKTASLIGALHYKEYGFLLRWLLKRISASANGPTDTSRDHELTDWNAVESFAKEFSQSITDAPSLASVR